MPVEYIGFTNGFRSENPRWMSPLIATLQAATIGSTHAAANVPFIPE